MSSSLLALRKLKYRFLSGLVGQQVTIPQITQLDTSILAAVSTSLTGNFSLKDSVDNIALIMGKYGFLDLTFTSAEPLLTSADKISRAVIRDLGYSPRPEDPARDLEPSIKEQLGSDRSCLEVLMEDIREESCFLRLFLNSKWSEDAFMRFMRQVEQERSQHKGKGEIFRHYKA